MKPLAGLKVLELARILAGPWAGQLLADLGATVIKVESPDGDDTRCWGPPFVERDGDTSAAYFYACNRGKFSITADLKDPQQLAHVKNLGLEADVLIENFKFQGLKKYGLDYESLSAENPGLIYCSITGFGQTGPYKHKAGYDYLVQGMSGLMSVTGPADGEPQKVGVALVDIFTGMYAASAIQAALIARFQSGKGDYIDMSLLDVGTAMMANQAMNYLVTGQSPQRMGNHHPNIVPYQVFSALDGDLIIAAGNDRQFNAVCQLLGRPDLSANPRYSSNPNRVENRLDLTNQLQGLIAKFKRDALIEKFEELGVPASPINTVGQAFEDPQILARGMRIEHDDVLGVRTPIMFSNMALSLDRPPPKLGEHEEMVKKSGWAIDH